MISSEAASPGSDSTVGKAGSLPFDVSVAHQARAYDYLLGGKDNYAADREAAEASIKVWPDMLWAARANRAFLGRVVRYLTAEAGIRQFPDIGTGIPTAGNLHEVAQAIAPQTRVVYVDYDPVVLAHARALLDSSEEGATEYTGADLRDTATILERAARLLDFTRPVAVTMLAVLHAVPDADDPYAIVTKIMDAVPPGSCLAVSHAAAGLLDGKGWRASRTRGAAGCGSRSPGVPASRQRGSSKEPALSTPVLCGSRSGARILTRATAARVPGGPGSDGNAEAPSPVQRKG